METLFLKLCKLKTEILIHTLFVCLFLGCRIKLSPKAQSSTHRPAQGNHHRLKETLKDTLFIYMQAYTVFTLSCKY